MKIHHPTVKEQLNVFLLWILIVPTMLVIAIGHAPVQFAMEPPVPNLVEGYTCWFEGDVAPVAVPNAALVIRDGEQVLIRGPHSWDSDGHVIFSNRSAMPLHLALEQALGGKKTYDAVLSFCADLDNPELRK